MSFTDLVDGVSKLTNINFESKEHQQAENFQKMAMAMAKDIRVILVKLADRLHNLRTLGSLKPEKRRRIAQRNSISTPPIANRLGLNSIRVEMEELCFEAMYPMRSDMIRKAVKAARGHRSEMVNSIQAAIRNRLNEVSISARVIGREKHLFSIYTKMKEKRKSLTDIMDVYGFPHYHRQRRHLLPRAGPDAQSCINRYRDAFKDYIAIPKTNGYQSLHTTLIGIGGVPIEIQIRTEEMESMANHGIAAHWLVQIRKRPAQWHPAGAPGWVQTCWNCRKTPAAHWNLLSTLKSICSRMKSMYYAERQNHGITGRLPPPSTLPMPYTPMSVTIALPAAFQPPAGALGARLQNGQTVQIRHRARRPSRTRPGSILLLPAKARSNIRNYLKSQRRSESVALGERLLNKALDVLGKTITDIRRPAH